MSGNSKNDNFSVSYKEKLKDAMFDIVEQWLNSGKSRDKILELAKQYATKALVEYDEIALEIELDKKGKGTGSALISIHLSFNSKNQLVVESLGNQPFRLVNGRHHTAAKSAVMRPKGRIQPASKRKVESLAKK